MYCDTKSRQRVWSIHFFCSLQERFSRIFKDCGNPEKQCPYKGDPSKGVRSLPQQTNNQRYSHGPDDWKADVLPTVYVLNTKSGILNANKNREQ